MMWIRWHGTIEGTCRAVQPVIVAVLVLCLTTGCAGPHFDITREIGLFPPQLENRSDFYEDAQYRCVKYDLKNKDSVECIRYWEALLWAQDYKSYADARAGINRNVIYLGGVLALASVGALVGLAAFGSTSSDAYKIIPIAGTFVAAVLGFSKNDALYEAYQGAATKIDQAIRLAEDKVAAQTSTSYEDASALLRREVGSAIDALNQTKVDIVKFQAKSEADQFKQVQQSAAEKDLAVFSLKIVKADSAKDPQKIIASLSSSPDPQKLSAGELRIKLTDSQSGIVQILRVSSLKGPDIEADIPGDLLDHGSRTYLTEVQARYGTYTLREAQSVTLNYTKVRFDVAVKGKGKVTYPVAGGIVTCQASAGCNTSKLPAGNAVTLTATPVAPETQVEWKSAPGCGVQTTAPMTCTITLTADTKVNAEFQ